MNVVTYLLGAGASAQCLPVVKNLSTRIRGISSTLRTSLTYKQFISHITLPEKMYNESDLVKEIIEDLEWMANECDKHSSIDTFAKKLYILKNHDQYIRLKVILSVYFTLEQKYNTPDLRYDNFWASIIESKDIFPDLIRIVSWNYDFQLEQSYLNFSDSNKLMDAYSKLDIRSFWDSNRKTDEKCFSVYKLNGSATISHTGEFPAYFSDNLDDDYQFYNTLLKRYALLKSNSHYKQNISFAWEHKLNHEYFKELKLSLWNTTTLVVIGYSFPYFNRKIDKYLLECMPFLEKVYFQAPDASNLKERFSAINTKILQANLLERVDLDQFTFPNEL
jgi:hypothetical protein